MPVSSRGLEILTFQISRLRRNTSCSITWKKAGGESPAPLTEWLYPGTAGDALNIDRTHLSKIEAGKRSCPIDLFVQLSAFFDVSLDYLILGKKENNETAGLVAELDNIISQLALLRKKI